MKMNYVVITGKELDSRKFERILGVFLAVILLCITAGNQTMTLPVKEGASDYLNRAESLTGDIKLIPEMNERCKLENHFNKLTGSQLSKIVELPRISEIGVFNNRNTGEMPVSIAEETPVTISDPTIIMEESSIYEPEAVIIPEESEPVLDDQIFGAEIPSVSEDAEERSETFICGGFLCDYSGIIIGCQDAAVTDGVLCLPVEESCTGIAAGALDSLGTEVYEIYIPKNIVLIEDGAFDGLSELIFIQVHPDNPVYDSDEGYLYKK